jgi:1-deoxy-D-xylulose-5-phosphate reductoisomerase
VAVEAFLQEQIGFLTITTIVEEMMMRHNCIQQATIEEILYADAEIKRQTRTYIDKHF